ncbi:Isopenicillin N epimerase component 1 [Triangularia setosa]|uniref:Very long-chain fatty acid transport protein n=1 Tax=Triangularia setosa TaxID=2587417 RepID=A0AAN7A596_9PEZI|nr:Isopenicillin N epimerase component 1 [Podospora setosa]
MDLLTSPPAVTAISILGALYLDAKLHLRKDLRWILGRKRIRSAFEKAVKQDRVSPYWFIVDNAARDPSREAIWARNPWTSAAESYTWQEVLERSNQYGHFFLSQGIKKGGLVAFFMLNSADFVFAWIGLWSIGAAPAMINYHLTGQALVHCLRISGAEIVLMDGDEAAVRRMEDVKSDVPHLKYLILRDAKPGLEGFSSDAPQEELRKGVQGGDPMALFYTSGTTGMPKGCMLPMVAAFAHGYGSVSGTNPVQKQNERYYVCMPYYHGTGGINAMAQLMANNTLLIAPKFSVSSFWTDIAQSRATWFVYVGETLRYLLSAPPSPLDRTHLVHSIYGNGLRPDIWNQFKSRFGVDQVFEFFNSTEGMLSLDNPSCNDYTACAVGHHGWLQRRKYHDYYVPVAVDPETGELMRDKKGWAIRTPYEVGGEILVRVPFERTFPGYWKNPEATEAKFVKDVFRKGDCFYRTGDALTRDKEGRWFFLDRLGDTFRWKGENVSTAEVSEVLGQYPGVLDANVYGVELPGHDGKAGTAAIYVDPAIKKGFNHQELLRHARTHLPKYAVPLFIRHVEAPSATHNNKQNKAPLKKEGVHPDRVAPGDKVFWIERQGKGATYVPFMRQDWEDLHAGKAKL